MATGNKNSEVLKDSAVAEAYLKKTLDIFTRTGDAKPFLNALSQLTKSQGGMTTLAVKCGTNRQSLYRAFAQSGNPKLKSLSTILTALGYTISVEPYKKEETDKEVEETIKRITTAVTEKS